MQIAAIKYQTGNLGDYIQSIALERLLPRVDFWINRDDMEAASRFDDSVRWVINGWYNRASHRIWPPPGNAKKLYLGFHATDSSSLPEESESPIGCRDPWTFQICTERGLDAWISFCATLTLDGVGQPQRDEVLLVDLPEVHRRRLPPEIAGGTKMTHWISEDADGVAIGNEYLERYARARWVVTTRLHVMLPCVAMGTPVVFIAPGWEAKRYLCYTYLAWRIETAPWDAPQPRFSADLVHSMTWSLRDVLRRFIEA